MPRSVDLRIVNPKDETGSCRQLAHRAHRADRAHPADRAHRVFRRDPGAGRRFGTRRSLNAKRETPSGGVATVRSSTPRFESRVFLELLVALFLGRDFVANTVRATDWRWSHPEPHGNNIADMVHRDGTYVHVTDRGGVYSSTNRLVWQRLESGTFRALRAAAFFGSRFLVTGEEGTVLWSDDLVRFTPGTIEPATSDWLEGVAASDSVAVAVGDNGAVYRSSDGKAWQRVALGQFSEWLTGVAFGSGVFVLTGDSGLIATSSDGLVWTRRSSRVSRNLSRVGFADQRFVAVGSGGEVTTSTTGAAWTRIAVTDPTNDLATTVVVGSEYLVAGESSMSLRVAGNRWENQLSAVVSPQPAPDWVYAAGIWDGNRYLVGGRTGVLVESFRTNAPPFQNATFWYRTEETPRNWLWDVAWAGGTYLAVGDQGTILSSPSGTDWALESVPVEVLDRVLYGVGGSDSWVLAVGEGGTILRSQVAFTNVVSEEQVIVAGITNRIAVTNHVSLAGIVWETTPSVPTTNTLQGIAWDGSLYVVTGSAGTVLTSADAFRWTRAAAGGSDFLSSVAVAGGVWVATGAKGAVYTSTDALQWTRRDSGTTNWIYRVARIGPEWIAVGERGLILASTDTTNWTSRPSGTTAWLTGLRAVGDVAYACGGQGTVLRSTNRIDWVSVPTLTAKALHGLSVNAGQVVVAGAEGVILRSDAEPAAGALVIEVYRRFGGLEPPVEALVFRGTPERRFRWESSENLGGWQVEGSFELGSDGSRVVGRAIQGPSRFHRAAQGPTE